MYFLFPRIPVLPDLSRPFPGGPSPRSIFFRRRTLSLLNRCIRISLNTAWALAGKGKNRLFRWSRDLTAGALCPPTLTVRLSSRRSPPPRRGEGRVGVMRVDIFMQRLGLPAGLFRLAKGSRWIYPLAPYPADACGLPLGAGTFLPGPWQISIKYSIN